MNSAGSSMTRDASRRRRTIVRKRPKKLTRVSVGTNTGDDLMGVLQEIKSSAFLCIQNTITTSKNINAINIDTVNGALDLYDKNKNINVPSLLRSVRDSIIGTNAIATHTLTRLSNSIARRINYTGPKESESIGSSGSSSSSSKKSIKRSGDEMEPSREEPEEEDAEEEEEDPLRRLAESFRVCDICYFKKQETEFAYPNLCSHVICKFCIQMYQGSSCMVCRTTTGAYTHIAKLGSRFGITLWFPVINETEEEDTEDDDEVFDDADR